MLHYVLFTVMQDSFCFLSAMRIAEDMGNDSHTVAITHYI